MQVGSFKDEEFQPLGIVRVTTESSIWFVTADSYQRLPRQEQPRPQPFSIELRLTTGSGTDFVAGGASTTTASVRCACCRPSGPPTASAS